MQDIAQCVGFDDTTFNATFLYVVSSYHTTAHRRRLKAKSCIVRPALGIRLGLDLNSLDFLTPLKRTLNKNNQR